MKACLLFIYILYYACAYESDEFPNVGTVLFSSSDSKKNNWAATEVSLLEARRYFQNLLPSPNIIDPASDNFVDTLLSYFSDAYLAIKREAYDSISDNIMTTALSDAIGGYIKMYVLPVTKFGFYSGTVSQKDAINMFTFYDEIQNFMETDGVGWRCPSDSAIKSLIMNIARPRHISHIRSMRDPCELIAYYEKTPNGIAVPIPHVNWNNELSTMLVPLKNHSLIVLVSPDPSDSLLKYYSTALDCLRSSSPQDVLDFDDKMQFWLTNDIVPHLSDDRLYLALNSVLTLVNDTTKLCHKLLGKLNQNYSNFFHIHMTSKKIIILSIILMLELISFIPAVMYIICCARKVKKAKLSKSTSFDSTSSKMKHDYDEFYKRNVRYYNDVPQMGSKSKSEMITQFPSRTYMHVTKDQNLGTSNKLSVATSVSSSLLCSTKHCSTDVFSIIKEPRLHSAKSSIRKIPSRDIPIDRSQKVKSGRATGNNTLLCLSSCKCTPAPSKTSTESFTTVQELKSSNTFTLVNDAAKPIKKNIFFQDQTIKKKSSFQLESLGRSDNHFQKIPLEKSASLQEKPKKNNCIHGTMSRKQNSVPGNFNEENTYTQKIITDQNEPEKNYSLQENLIDNNKVFETDVEKCSLSKTAVDDTSISGLPTDFCKQLSFDLTYPQIVSAECKDIIDQKIETQIAKAKLLIKNEEEDIVNPGTRFISPKKDIYKPKNVGFTINAGSYQPYFEIKLNRPRTEKTVDVKEITGKNCKPSKIPRRSIKNTFVKTVPQRPMLTSSSLVKSMIPLLKRMPLDDIHIRNNEKMQTDDRLNVTL